MDRTRAAPSRNFYPNPKLKLKSSADNLTKISKILTDYLTKFREKSDLPGLSLTYHSNIRSHFLPSYALSDAPWPNIKIPFFYQRIFPPLVLIPLKSSVDVSFYWMKITRTVIWLVYLLFFDITQNHKDDQTDQSVSLWRRFQPMWYRINNM